MKKNNRNQGQPGRKKGGKPNQQQNINKAKHKPENEPVARQGSGAGQGRQSQDQRSREWQGPVTNQDEQRKATNVGSSKDQPMREEEIEGDKRI